jgi:hypothetical protein
MWKPKTPIYGRQDDSREEALTTVLQVTLKTHGVV